MYVLQSRGPAEVDGQATLSEYPEGGDTPPIATVYELAVAPTQVPNTVAVHQR